MIPAEIFKDKFISYFQCFENYMCNLVMYLKSNVVNFIPPELGG